MGWGMGHDCGRSVTRTRSGQCGADAVGDVELFRPSAGRVCGGSSSRVSRVRERVVYDK